MADDIPAERFSPLVPLIIGSAMMIQTINSTVIVNALPTMARALGTDPVSMDVAITSYLLASAIFLPLSGWLADRYGSRTVFRAAILVYLVSSACCGLSQTLPQLILARIAEGASGAMMTPVGRMVMLRSVSRRDLVRATAYLTTPSLLGPVLGPPIGGFIVTFWSWRWIFFLNVPIGLIAAVLVTRYIPNFIGEKRTRLDIKGAVLTGTGMAGLIFGLQNIGHGSLPLAVSGAMTIGGIVALALYMVHARRAEAPILDFALLRVRTFSASILGGQFVRMLNGATPFLLAMLLQVGFGMSALASGLMTFVSAIAALLMKATARPILQWFGFRTVLVVNAFVVAATFTCYGLFKPSTPHLIIIAALFTGGFFRSLQFTALNSVAYVDVPKENMGSGSTLLAMSQPIARSLGIALAGTIIHMLTRRQGLVHPIAATITPAFYVLGIGSLISLAFFLPLAPDTGADVSGHRLPG